MADSPFGPAPEAAGDPAVSAPMSDADVRAKRQQVLLEALGTLASIVPATRLLRGITPMRGMLAGAGLGTGMAALTAGAGEPSPSSQTAQQGQGADAPSGGSPDEGGSWMDTAKRWAPYVATGAVGGVAGGALVAKLQQMANAKKALGALPGKALGGGVEEAAAGGQAVGRKAEAQALQKALPPAAGEAQGGVGAHTSEAALKVRADRMDNWNRLTQGEMAPVIDRHLSDHINDAANYVKTGSSKGALSNSSIRALQKRIEADSGPISYSLLRKELRRRGAVIAGD